MLRLLLIAIALLHEQTVKPPGLLLFHPQTETGAEEQIVRQVKDTVGKEAGITLHEDSALEELGGPDAGSDRRLRVYHAMRRAGAQGAWTITFLRSKGVVMIEAFDNRQGVRAARGTKIRSMAEERLSDEQLERLNETLTAVQRQLADKIRFLETSRTSPYCETITWRHSELPPHPGFRWAFEEQGARVTYVFETSSMQRGGLQVGDLIVSINGSAVPSPPHFGRALGPLRAGHELKLTVLRGEETVELAGKVESSAELIPRWQAGIVGKQAPLLKTPIGTGSRSSSEHGDRAVLIVVFRPAMPETWECFSVLRWIRDHYPEQELAIIGIAAHTEEQALRRFLDQRKPGWPSLPDPDGRLTEALRVHLPPAFLLVDRQGVLRFVQVDEAHLRQAIDTL